MRAALVFAMGLAAYAQPALEIATLKRSPPPEGDLININLGNVRNGQLTLANVTLSECLIFAYDLTSNSQLVGPDWTKSRAIRFDIVAQVPPDMPREQMLLRLQSLLADRLRVALHHEQKERPYLALTVAKNGPKLPEVQPARAGSTGLSILGRIAGTQMQMRTLALLISRFQGQIVLDQTGLPGFYEVKLEWTPDLNRPQPPDSDAPPGPSIFTAVQEQLGLRLESRKGPVDVLVVDHAEQIPAEN
jgi:uncharacterized protein (TIGR03435 family)